MSLSSIEVWQRITESGLADAKQCREWAAQAAKSAPDTVDGMILLQRLVRLKCLTKYQARVLAGQLSSPLLLGNWRVGGTLIDSNWKGWLEVSSNADDQVQTQGLLQTQGPRWSKCLTAAELKQLRQFAPSMDFARQQAKIEGAHLQRVFEPEIIDGQVVLHVAPVRGKTLIELFPSSPPDAELAQAIILQVSSALANMHRAGLAHGCVRPDRVYWDGRQAVLVRDPICRFPVSLNGREGGSIGPPMDYGQPEDSADALEFLSHEFMAPEFMAPGQLPTLRTDVYALGCLWRWLRTRKSTSGQAGITNISEQVLGDGANPKSVRQPSPGSVPAASRVLQVALAKQPAHRFASAVEFCQALQIAVELKAGRPPHDQANVAVSASSTTNTTSAPTRRPPEPAGSLPKAKQATPDNSNKSKRGATPNFSQTSRLKKRRHNRKNGKWLLPLMGGGGLLIVLMLTLHFSGALRRSSSTQVADRKPPPFATEQPAVEIAEPDPLSDYFVLVESNETALWAPPAIPVPVTFELLPPGGQCFIALLPASLNQSGALKNLRSAQGGRVEELIQSVSRRAGVAFEQMRRCTFAFYNSQPEGSFPQIAMRVDLEKGQSVTQLLNAWGSPKPQEVPNEKLFLSENVAYFVQEPVVGGMITSFSVGPPELMREVAEVSGAEGPLVTQVERLRKVSDSQADIVVLLAPAFLYSQGHGLLERMPKKLRELLPELLDVETRAALLQTRFSPQWYVEAQLIGQSDREAGQIAVQLEAQLSELPRKVEDWLVAEIPHPYWRALALRYPQMLRSFAKYTRFGVENGAAVMNTYLPTQASENLLLTSWLALQDNATGPNESNSMPAEVAQQPLTIEEYLARPVKVSFAQEPIETALTLVGEEANGGLPPGSLPWRFELDGDAFENAGITRNQQLRDYRQENTTVRQALTEIALRGNPVTTVTDPRDEDQQLIWVVRDDPQSPGNPMVSLTTRTAARSSGIALPVEFAP